MTLNSNRSFFNKYSLYFFVMSLVILFCGVFFTFKIFSKTTHNVKFVINSQNIENSNININDVMDIEILHDNQDVETLIGMTTNVEENKKITFRVKLKEGYHTVNNSLLTASNILNNNNNYIDSTFEDDSYQWTTDEITSDRTIEINNIEIIKFEVPEPVIYDYDNNIVDPSLYSLINWDSYVNYDNKYEFGLDLSQFEENYKIKSTVIQTDLDGELSCEISNFDDKQYILEIYDHDNEFGGITSNINKFEIFLTPEYVEDSLILASTSDSSSSSSSEAKSFDNNGTCKINNVKFTIDSNCADYINKSASSVALGNSTGEYTVTLMPKNGYKIESLSTNSGSISPVESGQTWTLSDIKTDSSGYDSAESDITVELTPVITGTANFKTETQDNSTITSCTIGGVEFTIDSNCAGYINIGENNGSKVAFTTEDNGKYIINLLPKDGYEIESLSTDAKDSSGNSVSLKSEKAESSQTWTLSGIQAGTDDKPASVSLTPAMARANVNFKLEGVKSDNVKLAGSLGDSPKITMDSVDTNEGKASCIIGETYTISGITESHYNISLTNLKPVTKNNVTAYYNKFIVSNDGNDKKVAIAHKTTSITLKWSTQDGDTDIGNPIEKIGYFPSPADGCEAKTDKQETTVEGTTVNGDNEKTFNVLKNHDCTIKIYLNNGYTQYIGDLKANNDEYNFSCNNDTNSIIFTETVDDKEKKYIELVISNVTDNKEITLSNFHHNDVKITFTLPKYGDTQLGMITGSDRSNCTTYGDSDKSKTIKHTDLKNSNESDSSSLDNLENLFQFKVKYGCKDLKYTYTACDFDNNSEQLNYYKIQLQDSQSGLNNIELVGSSNDNQAIITINSTTNDQNIDLSLAYKLALRMVAIKFEAGNGCTGENLAGVNINLLSGGGGVDETWENNNTNTTGDFNLGVNKDENGKIVNVSDDVNFSIQNTNGYTTGIMTADLSNNSTLNSNHGLGKVFTRNTENPNSDNPITSTTNLTDKISITADSLMKVYNGDGTTITITLDNIKKLYTFSFGVNNNLGTLDDDDEDKKAIEGITASAGTYIITENGFTQRGDDLKVIYGQTSGKKNSAVFIPDGCEFSYTITLSTDLYKLATLPDGATKNGDFSYKYTINDNYDDQTFSLEKNYKLAYLNLSHVGMDDTDYNVLAGIIKVSQNEKELECVVNGNLKRFKFKIRNNESNCNKIVIKKSVGVEFTGTEDNPLEFVSYNNGETYLKAETSAESISDNQTNYYIIDFDQEDIKGAFSADSTPIFFTLHAKLHTCTVTLNCSGMDELYGSGDNSKLLYNKEEWTGEKKIKVLYGNSAAIRMIFNSSNHNITETGNFLSSVEDYVSVVTEDNKEYPLTSLTENNDDRNNSPNDNIGPPGYSLEISQIDNNDGNSYHEVRVSIFNIKDNVTLHCDADSANHQIVKFSEIPGIKYIKLKCEETGNSGSNDSDKSSYSYSTEGVKFTNMTLNLPTKTNYYFAVFTENSESIDIKKLTMKLNNTNIWTIDSDGNVIKNTNKNGVELIGIVNNINLGDKSVNLETNNLKINESNSTVGFAFRLNFDDILKVEDKKQNAVISGEVPKVTFTVKFETPELNYLDDYPDEKRTHTNSVKYKDYYTKNYLDTKEVDYGSSVEFYIELAEHCNKSNFKVFVKKSEQNHEELSAVGGRYVYYNITENMTVYVQDLTLNQYVVNFTNNDKVTYYNNSNNRVITGLQNMYYGDDMEFTVKPNTGYTLGDNLILNKYIIGEGTSTIDPDNSSTTDNKIYKLNNIVKDITISVDKVENVRYTVTLTPIDGVQYYNDSGLSISGDLKVTYGSSFEFGVSVADAYDESIPGMHIIVNDNKSSKSNAQKLSTGKYMVPNIREDINIKVGNISKNKYIVTLKDVEGADYYDISGTKIITGDNEVAHGENLNFKVQLYPAYADSQIKIMRGTQELNPDENNIYTVKNVTENLYVEIGGIDKTLVAKLIETIENLPGTINSEEDVYDIIEATKTYESLTEEQKLAVSNYNILENLQQAVRPFHHEYNNLLVEGLDWHIKLIANPISSDMEVCSRIYDKLSSEYILSLYDIYLWDTIKDEKYTLPEDQTIVIKLPTPDMNYFEDPSGIHEKEEKKLEFLNLTSSNGYSSMETNSLSPMGIIAKRTNQSGRSSLIDSLGEDLQTIADYTLNTLTGKKENSDENNLSYLLDQDDSQEEVEEYQRENTNTDNIGQTQIGSALKLVLILLIILIILTGVLIFIKNRKDSNKNTKK